MKQADQNTKRASVYLMRCEDYVKIGVAVSVGWRQVALQTGNPFDITIVGQRLFPDFSVATRAEAVLHERFADRRHRGEWFRISDDEALTALRGIALDEVCMPETVTIEWMPFKGRPGFTEEVPKESV